MNIENKVFGKLFQEEKLELQSNKFEFALADDIESARNAGLKNVDGIKSSFNKASTSLIQYKDSIANTVVSFNKVLDLIGQMKAKSKELGIEIAPKYLNLDKEASQYVKQYTAKYKAIDAVIKSM